MSSEASDTPTGTSVEPAPETKGVVVEQTKQPLKSLQDILIAEAKSEGQITDDTLPVEPVVASDSPEPEEDSDESELPEQETPETPAEGEDVPEEELAAAEKPKGPDPKKLVPLGAVLEEREKKQRANDRADRVEAELQKAQSRLQELETQLSQSGGPMPNENNPVIDIQDPLVLDKHERVYEAMREVNLENLNEDGSITMPSAIGADGQFVYRKLDPESARLAQVRADRVVRKSIPERRKYLDDRAKIDAQANQWYPDLQNTEHEFTKVVNQMTNNVLSGRVQNDPSVRLWVANALYGYMQRKAEAEASTNGSGKAEVKKIVEGSKVKVAPTAPRGRSLPSKSNPGADLAKANQRLKENPDSEEAQLAYIAAARSQKDQKQLHSVVE